MLIGIATYLKTGIEHPVTQLILRLFSIFSLFSACLTLGGFFFYTIGYSFLYGYYFSGSMHNEVSLIDMLIKNIPFPLYSVLITSIAFIVAVSLFVFILYHLILSAKQLFTKGERGFGLLRFFMTMIGSIVFHFTLTSYFVGGVPSSSGVVVQFGFIWAGPFLLAVLLYSFFRMINGPFSAVSGLLYGFITVTVIGSVFDVPPSELWILVLFAASLVFSFFEHWIRYAVYRAILWFPAIFISFILTIFMVPLLKPKSIAGWIVFFILTTGISVLLALFIKKKSNHHSAESNKEKKTENRPKFKVGSIVTLLIVVLASFLATSIPVIAESTGTYFRDLTPKKARQTMTYDDGQVIEDATLVAKKDNTYYISSSDWKLIVLRTEWLRIDDSGE